MDNNGIKVLISKLQNRYCSITMDQYRALVLMSCHVCTMTSPSLDISSTEEGSLIAKRKSMHSNYLLKFQTNKLCLYEEAHAIINNHI